MLKMAMTFLVMVPSLPVQLSWRRPPPNPITHTNTHSPPPGKPEINDPLFKETAVTQHRLLFVWLLPVP